MLYSGCVNLIPTMNVILLRFQAFTSICSFCRRQINNILNEIKGSSLIYFFKRTYVIIMWRVFVSNKDIFKRIFIPTLFITSDLILINNCDQLKSMLSVQCKCCFLFQILIEQDCSPESECLLK